MVVHARALVSTLVALSLAAGHLAPVFAAAGTLTKAEYEGCQTRDDATFRAAIEAITLDSLKRSLATFDYKSTVGSAWRSTGMDAILEKRIDEAVAEVGKETTWGNVIWSTFDQKIAQELATKVSERVYKSDAIKKGIEAVAGDVGRTLGLSLEFASQDAAGPAISCVKAYLGPRYGMAVSASVSGQAEQEFAIDSAKGKAAVTPGDVVSKSGAGIAGAALVVVRRQLANMASRVGARIAGTVLSRLVSIAAGGVGAVLIARDVWALGSGVLPIIATEMKSASARELVQAELAKSISEQIGEHIKELAAQTSSHIVEIWNEFRRAHLKSLEFADRNAGFRSFLDSTAPPKLPRLDEIVGIVLASEGEAAVLNRLADGTLNTAVNVLTAPAIDIARDTRSLETALKWSALAGDQLPKVAEMEIYRRAAPGDFTKASLSRLVALDDKVAISRLAALKRDARETLFDLDTGELKSLARALPEPELATLSSYLTGLEKKPRERVLRTIAATPAKMRILASARVRDAVLASRDQSSAVDMMLRAGAATPTEIAGDVKLAWEGQISPVLMWERHPIVTAMGLIPLLVLLLLLRRVFMPRRKPQPPPAAA